MSTRRRIASDGALSLMAGASSASDDSPGFLGAAPPGGESAPPLALKSCMLLAEEVHLGRLLGAGSQGTVYDGEWRGAPVAVKVMTQAFPRHMLGRKGSGDLTKMMRALEGAPARGLAATRSDGALD